VQIQHLQMLNVMKNLAIADGFLVLAAHGWKAEPGPQAGIEVGVSAAAAAPRARE
jgi:hypothetical protein